MPYQTGDIFEVTDPHAPFPGMQLRAGEIDTEGPVTLIMGHDQATGAALAAYTEREITPIVPDAPTQTLPMVTK